MLSAQAARPVLAVVLVAGVVGCGVTKTSTSCENAECDAKLSGGGAHVDLDSLGLAIALDDTDGDKAKLKITRLAGGADQTVELSEGESTTALGARIKLGEVDGDTVTLHAGPG